MKTNTKCLSFVIPKTFILFGDVYTVELSPTLCDETKSYGGYYPDDKKIVLQSPGRIKYVSDTDEVLYKEYPPIEVFKLHVTYHSAFSISFSFNYLCFNKEYLMPQH